eukprot:gene14058-biopygen23092
MGSRGSRPPRAAAADDTGNPTPEIRGTKLSWMPCSLLGVLWSGYQKRLQFGAGAQLCSSCEGPSSHVLIGMVTRSVYSWNQGGAGWLYNVAVGDTASHVAVEFSKHPGIRHQL